MSPATSVTDSTWQAKRGPKTLMSVTSQMMPTAANAAFSGTASAGKNVAR